ncbi:MAG: signal peptidase I [Limisphaerales bacterium]
MSLFISGASQFLAGRKFQGITWFFGLLLLFIGCVWCLASPIVPGDFPAFVLYSIYIVLWIVMLIKSYQPVPRFRWYGWILLIFLTLVIPKAAYRGFITFFRIYKIPTASMSPTIQGNTKRADGTTVSRDHICIERYVYWFSKPQRGDIIVFEAEGISEDQREIYRIPPSEFYVKRIVGIPGDDLSIQNGHLYNHGQILSQPPILAKLEFFNPFTSQVYLINPTNDYKVPDGCYFVVGDNTINSLDSRFYGAVSQNSIIGRVSKIYWPLDRVGRVQ